MPGRTCTFLAGSLCTQLELSEVLLGLDTSERQLGADTSERQLDIGTSERQLGVGTSAAGVRWLGLDTSVQKLGFWLGTTVHLLVLRLQVWASLLACSALP